MEDFLDRVKGSIAGLRRRRLGERAVAARLITPGELEEALRDASSDLGSVLVSRGWITPGELDALLLSLDSPPPLTGSARYQLGEKLGEGAMSVVHRGTDRQLGRPVAIKILRDSFLTHSTVRGRFAREARVLARLDHPNVVKVFDAMDVGGQAWLVMELVEGEALSRILAVKPRDRTRLLALLEKVARGIHHAHEKGVIHRDLKPDNILVTGEEPKVADFGLAHLAESAPELTRSGTVLGTPMYMAPEQVEGGRLVTPLTDVYALGALLYEILTGRPPHTGASIPEVYASIARDEPAPPRKAVPATPWELEAIALKALEKNPARRYPSACAFADDLRRHLAGEPIVARPVSAITRLRRRASKHRAVLIPAVLAAIALAAWAYRDHRARTAEAVRDSRARAEREALRLLEAARPPLEKATAALYDNDVSAEGMLASAATAQALAARAIEQAPDLPLGHYRLGEALELRGEYAGAQEAFARAVALDPRFGSARYRLGRVLLWRAYGASFYFYSDDQEARRAEAEQMVRQGITEIEAAQGSGFDNDLQREIASGMLAYLRREKPRVQAICREGIARFGKKEGVEEFHWLLALVLGDRAAQRKAFDEALSLRPKFPLALYSRATVRDVDGAIEDYGRAIAISPGFMEAYLNRGSAHYARRDAPAAYADFDHLVRSGVFLAPAYNGRGRTVLDLMNDPARAIPDLDEAIRLRPAGYVLPYLARAKARLLRREYDAAVADATAGISIQGWPELFFIRGQARAARGDRTAGIADLEEALKRGGGSAEFRQEVAAAIERAKLKP